MPSNKATWNQIRARCYNPKHPKYPFYGGRGVGICPQWRFNFAQFDADMGQRPPNTSLELIDHYGNYEPSNVKWALMGERIHARKHFAQAPGPFYVWEGVMYTLKELAEASKIPIYILRVLLIRCAMPSFSIGPATTCGARANYLPPELPRAKNLAASA